MNNWFLPSRGLSAVVLSLVLLVGESTWPLGSPSIGDYILKEEISNEMVGPEYVENETTEYIQEETTTDEPTTEEIETIEPTTTPEIEDIPMEPVGKPMPIISQKDIELIALVMLAEAEGECELGQRLVIDVILNRMDSPRYPNNAHDVIYQRGQFTSMWGTRVDRVTVTDEAIDLVEEELASRTNYEVLYFRTKHYHKFGTPLFQVGNHYFSTY